MRRIVMGTILLPWWLRFLKRFVKIDVDVLYTSENLQGKTADFIIVEELMRRGNKKR